MQSVTLPYQARIYEEQLETITPLESIDRCTLSGHVYERIKQAIISGSLVPGTRLTEKNLMDRLSVSRSTVREAISRLVHEGYLKGRPYEGYRVNLPTIEEVKSIYELLIELTSVALRLALDRVDERQLAELISLVDAGEAALAQGKTEAYSNAGWQFRNRAAEYSQNQHLQNLFEQYSHHPALLRPWAIDDLDSVRRRAVDFPALKQAVMNRDATGAAEIVAEHLRLNLQEVLARLISSKASPGDAGLRMPTGAARG